MKWYFKTYCGKYGPFDTEERAKASFEDWIAGIRRNVKMVQE